MFEMLAVDGGAGLGDTMPVGIILAINLCSLIALYVMILIVCRRKMKANRKAPAPKPAKTNQISISQSHNNVEAFEKKFERMWDEIAG
jgi:hypothetical protein